MQSWRGWYSTGLEIRHPERVSGFNITRLRVAAGLTVRDLQDIFGFATPQAIYKWQHGTAMPTLDNLVVLAAVFGVAMDDIIVIDSELKTQISA